MTLRGGQLFGISALVAIQLATAFSAIGLLTRMSPAVERILAENVYSNEAAEQMVAALALQASGAPGDHRAAYFEAVRRARENITEAAEVPVVDRLEELGGAIFDRGSGDIAGTVEATRQLIEINRGAMQRANVAAQRMGTAGAWAAVTLSMIAFFVSLIVVRRIMQGVVEPVEELESALDAFISGDTYRRCQARAASPEMRAVLRTVNKLLDRAPRSEADSAPA